MDRAGLAGISGERIGIVGLKLISRGSLTGLRHVLDRMPLHGSTPSPPYLVDGKRRFRGLVASAS